MKVFGNNFKTFEDFKPDLRRFSKTQPSKRRSSKFFKDVTFGNKGFRRFSKGRNLCAKRWFINDGSSTMVCPLLYQCDYILSKHMQPLNLRTVYFSHLSCGDLKEKIVYSLANTFLISPSHLLLLTPLTF